jgi:hypothetical protein
MRYPYPFEFAEIKRLYPLLFACPWSFPFKNTTFLAFLPPVVGTGFIFGVLAYRTTLSQSTYGIHVDEIHGDLAFFMLVLYA